MAMPRLVQARLPLDETASAVALVYASWSEDMLLNNVRHTARLCNYLVYHTRFSIKSDAGFPDLVLVGGPRGSRLIFAELKREGRWPTEGHLSKGLIPRWIAGQAEWLDALSHTLAEVYLWWPSDIHDIATILADGATEAMGCVRRTREYLHGVTRQADQAHGATVAAPVEERRRGRRQGQGTRHAVARA